MKAYKGFNKDMTCRGFQYEEGKTYETDTAVLCESGFHACYMPLQTFAYYRPSESVYHEVEVDDISTDRNHSGKVAAKKITIGARLNISDLVKAQIGMVAEKSNGGRLASGDGSSAAANGDGSSAAANGYRSSAVANGYGSSAAASGDESSAAANGYGSSAAASGYESSAAANGDGSSAVANGYGSSAAAGSKNGIALANGRDSRAAGVIGSWLVLTEWRLDEKELLCVKTVRVDGKKIKADTFYKLVNGNVVKVEGLT